MTVQLQMKRVSLSAAAAIALLSAPIALAQTVEGTVDAAKEAAQGAATAASEAAQDAAEAVKGAAADAAEAVNEALKPKPVAVPVPAGVYQLDKTHANVLFQVVHAGLAPYTARFDRLDGALTLDPANPENSSVTATIEAGSVNTNYPGTKDFNGEISFNEKFLNANAFPDITFTSTAVELTSPNTAEITGDLTMLGVTKPITLDAELTGALEKHPFAKGKPAIGFTAEGVLDRTEWGFTNLSNTMPGLDGAAIVGTEVRVMIQAEFVKTDE